MFSKERKWENSSTREAIQAPKPEIRAIMTRRGHCKKHTIWKKRKRAKKNLSKTYVFFCRKSHGGGANPNGSAATCTDTHACAQHKTFQNQGCTFRWDETIHFQRKKNEKEVIKNICVFSVKEGLSELGPTRERCDMHEPTRLCTTLAYRRGPRVQCLFIYR